ENDIAEVVGAEKGRIAQAHQSGKHHNNEDNTHFSEFDEDLYEAPLRVRIGLGICDHPCSPFDMIPDYAVVAAAVNFSCGASARLNWPVKCPSSMTRIRSLMPRTSGNSEEISKIASPCAARLLIKRCTAALVPTSIPRVGSSRMSTRGWVSSHFASTTFC